MSNYVSYASILKNIENFKKSGTKNSGFNIYDTPSHKFFKIFFYFGDTSLTSNEFGEFSNGLLHPTWKIFGDKSESEISMLGLKYYDYNSAWSYLKLNDENERAEKLEKFVTLLSNINSESPWYFSSISGIDSALERKVTEDGNLDRNESGKLTITCLPDAFDNRIGTLLELYRDITWSWHHKKAILPTNLRKFDMAIYIFESPIEKWHNDDEKYINSYKLLEFHDCEFNYNSLKSGISELNNTEGVTPTYSIEISYNDCFEESYNEILMRKIGDVIITDTYQAVRNESGDNISKMSEVSESQVDNEDQISGIEERTDYYDYYIPKEKFPESEMLYSNGNLELRNNSMYVAKETDRPILETEKEKTGFLGNVAKELYHTGRQHVDNLLYEKTGFTTNIKRALLGNLYTYSLTQIGSQIGEAMKGKITSTGQTVKQYIDNAQARAAAKIKNKPTNNIFKTGNSDTSISKSNLGDIFEEPAKSSKSNLGDIFEDNPYIYNWKLGNIFE